LRRYLADFSGAAFAKIDRQSLQQTASALNFVLSKVNQQKPVGPPPPGLPPPSLPPTLVQPSESIVGIQQASATAAAPTQMDGIQSAQAGVLGLPRQRLLALISEQVARTGKRQLGFTDLSRKPPGLPTEAWGKFPSKMSEVRALDPCCCCNAIWEDSLPSLHRVISMCQGPMRQLLSYMQQNPDWSNSQGLHSQVAGLTAAPALSKVKIALRPLLRCSPPYESRSGDCSALAWHAGRDFVRFWICVRQRRCSHSRPHRHCNSSNRYGGFHDRLSHQSAPSINSLSSSASALCPP